MCKALFRFSVTLAQSVSKDQRYIIEESIMKNFSPRNKPAWILAAALLASTPLLHAATTDIANAPPATTTVILKPNVMFILDNSGSTSADNMPDHVNDPNTAKTNCTSTGGTSSSCSSPNTAAQRGDVPYYASQFNGVFYDPQVTYVPGKNFDGTGKPSQVSPWTAVSTDGYLGGGTINLTTSFPERVYCNSSSVTPPSTSCKRNGIDTIAADKTFSYIPVDKSATPASNGYPDGTYKFPKTLNGTPFYYDMVPVEWCDSVYLTNCSATQGMTFTIPAPVRYCKSAAIAATNPTDTSSAGANGTSGSPLRSEERRVGKECRL